MPDLLRKGDRIQLLRDGEPVEGNFGTIAENQGDESWYAITVFWDADHRGGPYEDEWPIAQLRRVPKLDMVDAVASARQTLTSYHRSTSCYPGDVAEMAVELQAALATLVTAIDQHHPS